MFLQVYTKFLFAERHYQAEQKEKEHQKELQFAELQHLAENAQQQISTLERAVPFPLDEAAARSKYLKALCMRYSSITLPIGPPQGLSIQAIFQPLKLRRDPLAAVDLAREERGALLGRSTFRDTHPRYPFIGRKNQQFYDQNQQVSPEVIAENGDDALKKSPSRSIVVLGGPGTGKTTMLTYLVGDYARKALADSTAPLPIFILLPDFARSGKTLKEYLSSLLEDMMVDEHFTQVLWIAIEQGQAYVCLDGLDEIPPKLRHGKIKLINEWAASTNTRYVIGSRFTDYKEGQLGSELFTEWELQPLNAALRQELAQRLIRELSKSVSRIDMAILYEASRFVRIIERHEQAAIGADWSNYTLAPSTIQHEKCG